MPVTVINVVQDLHVGGTERRMLNLAAALDRERFKPVVCCIDRLGPLADEGAGLAIAPLVLSRPWGYDLSGVRELAGVVPREPQAIVHSWLYLANVFGRLGGRIGGAAGVVAADGATEIPASPGKRLVAERVDRALSMLSDSIVANSHAVAASLRARGIPARKITVIHNGVAVAPPASPEEVAQLRASLGVPVAAPLVGMVARLTAVNKDHETFLRAAARIRRERPDVSFALVGDGPEHRRLVSLAEALGISDNVVFAGHRPDARRLISAFDVSVLCSLYEGFSNVVLESMASARPVVATDIAPNREAIEDGVHGMLVPLRDDAAAANAIARLLADPAEAARLAARGRERVVSEFSLAAQSERTMELYERLLRARRA